MIVQGRDVIAVPQSYIDEFRRDPVDALIKYGSLPQRSHAPWFTNVETINRALVLPDVVCGPGAVPHATMEYSSLIGSATEFGLLDGLSPHFHATDASYWHVHVDLALNKKRQGDAAGIAMGREAGSWMEHGTDGLGVGYQRVMRQFEIPLVAQILAPSGDQIYLSAITRLILQLKQIRGFNITSFSFDGFQSAGSMQELALAGLVTAGMVIEDTGEITGMPKPFSVDGRSEMPYRELLEAANESRIQLPRYELLKKEMREVEVVQPGLAPDHPIGGTKDVLDPVAGVVGYLAAYGHAALHSPLEGQVFTGEDLGIEPHADYFGVEDAFDWNPDPLAASGGGVNFGVE